MKNSDTVSVTGKSLCFLLSSLQSRRLKSTVLVLAVFTMVTTSFPLDVLSLLLILNSICTTL